MLTPPIRDHIPLIYIGICTVQKMGWSHCLKGRMFQTDQATSTQVGMPSFRDSSAPVESAVCDSSTLRTPRPRSLWLSFASPTHWHSAAALTPPKAWSYPASVSVTLCSEAMSTPSGKRRRTDQFNSSRFEFQPLIRDELAEGWRANM